MPAPTQKGQEMLVGIGDLTFTGYFVETADVEPIADVDVIKDENGATVSVIISDPGKRITESMLVKADSGDAIDTALDTRKIGDTVTVNSIGYRIESWKPSRTRGVTKVDWVGIKEDSMTYI